MNDGENDVSRYNIRKSLKSSMHRPNHVVDKSRNVQRKTLIHSKSDDYYPCQKTDDSGNGFQNSHFNLQNVENKLAHLAQIHLVLEHMLLIRSTLNLENGKTKKWEKTELISIFDKTIIFSICSLFVIFGWYKQDCETLPLPHRTKNRQSSNYGHESKNCGQNRWVSNSMFRCIPLNQRLPFLSLNFLNS